MWHITSVLKYVAGRTTGLNIDVDVVKKRNELNKARYLMFGFRRVVKQTKKSRELVTKKKIYDFFHTSRIYFNGYIIRSCRVIFLKIYVTDSYNVFKIHI